ncbi:MAG: NAD(P)-binding domain-containing protein [Candidatus Eremiobacteraeota bacterium]|nr:NAD(P)-binding domain-containing protein [Candidatus Eremiobacteraeota bacterium]
MRIGILGSGDVAKALARGFRARGHDVRIGSREPEKLEEFARETGSSAGSFADAAAFGDPVVVATLFSGTKNALELAGIENFGGKTVLDVTNPLKFEEGKLPELALGFNDSAGESIARWLPNAHVVKAFNSVGSPYFVDPQFAEGKPSMFMAGDDQNAKDTIAGIIESFGWDPIDVGGIVESRLLEPLCILWVRYGIRSANWHHAFKLLRG